MNVIELFKNDLWNGIGKHAKNLFKPMTIVAGIAFLASTGFMFLVLSKIIGTDAVQQFTDPTSMFDMESSMERSQAIADAMQSFGMTSLFALFLVGMIVGLIIMSWLMNFLLVLSQSVIDNNEMGLAQSFKQSFNKNVFKLVGLHLIIFIAYILLVVVVSLLGAASFILAFLGICAVMVFLLRFSAGFGAIVHGDMGVTESISFSFTNITFVRALKMFLVIFVFSIVYVLVLLLFSSIFKFMGSVGSVLMMVFQVALSIITYSFMTAGLSAAFYRYVEVEYEESNEVVNHIIDTDE